MKCPWPVSTPLFNDELLSSWLIRSALNNGCDPMSLTSYLWSIWRPWTVDFDRTIKDEKLAYLSSIFNTGINTFQHATLRPIASKIQSAPLSRNTTWPWILSTGSRNINKKGGLQYCPKCFDNNDAYYKKDWRLAWHTCCTKHNLILLDKCENCHLPIEPHKLEAISHSFTDCSNCGFDLRKAKTTPPPEQVILFQKNTDAILVSNNYSYQNKCIDTIAWFQLCTFFTQLVKRITKRNHQRLLAFAETLQLPIQHIPKHTASLENMNTKMRVKILQLIQILLNIKQEDLLSALEYHEVSQQAFAPKNTVLPKCLKSISAQLPKTPYGNKTVIYKQPLLPQPRPRHEVEKKALDIIRALNQ